MSVPVVSSPSAGLERSARLMRALGANAGPIWSELSPAEASALTAAMEQLEPGGPDSEERLAHAFLEDQQDGAKTGAGLGGDDLWAQFGALDLSEMRALLAGEPAQTISLIASCLEPGAAARLLRALSPPAALEVLRRLLKLSSPHPAALQALETYLADRLAANRDADGHQRVARIFDRLSGGGETKLLAALEQAEPGAGTRVRALMFTFDDLAALSAPGLQTLLASVDRNRLVIALKGAKPKTAQAFFNNMTSRAGAFLREEIEALGPVRRGDVEAARSELVSLARHLIERGEIGPQSADEELIE